MVMRISTLVTLISAAILRMVASGQALPLETEMTNGSGTKYFSADYKKARMRFLEGSHLVGASIESFKNPYTSPEGEPLFTDVVQIGPKNAKIILVLVSGTHGVEGFTGSGIQTGLLREGFTSRLKPGMNIIMIHALNPYGFSHLRRFNENNVDPNYNFGDHSKPYPGNSGYDELADAISPESMSLWANAKARFQFLWYRLRNGKLKLKEAISGGQHTHPQDLFYGGQSEMWSNKTIRVIASRYLANAEQVVIVDFHTGLGSYGHAEVILNEKEDSPAYQRAVGWWGGRVKTTASGQSVSVHLHETLKLAFPKMLPNAEVTAVSLEFGTFSPVKVFWALRAENWLHHYSGEEHPDSKKIKAELLRMFYPDSDDWKNLVWNQGKEVAERALSRLKFSEKAG
jgi:hypothetical protein